MEVLQKIALVLTIIGAVIWGMVGLFDFNPIDYLFGMNMIARIIYRWINQYRNIIRTYRKIASNEAIFFEVLLLFVLFLIHIEDENQFLLLLHQHHMYLP